MDRDKSAVGGERSAANSNRDDLWPRPTDELSSPTVVFSHLGDISKCGPLGSSLSHIRDGLVFEFCFIIFHRGVYGEERI